MQPPFSHTRWDRQRPIWTSLNTSCNSGLTLTYPFISYRTQTQADLPHWTRIHPALPDALSPLKDLRHN